MPVYEEATKIVELGEELDIIFELTGVPAVRQILRAKLQASGNRPTVIVPEIVVRLLWSFIGEGVELSGPVRDEY